MGWSLLFHGSKCLSGIYVYGTTHPEVVLLASLMLFLVLRQSFRAALVLAFGVTLCFGNYFVFAEYNVLTVPLVYPAGFAAISIVLLLLLVYQFIHTV